VTSDGIDDVDWDAVHELALAIANASVVDAGQAERETERLMELLGRLESRYGPRPSLLATRADYAASWPESIALLKRAFELAQEHRDTRNLTYVSSSLAQRFIEDARDPVQGAYWLGQLEAALGQFGDRSDIEELMSLRTGLEKLRNELENE